MGIVAAPPPQIYPQRRVLQFRPLFALAFTLALPTCASSDECTRGERRACEDGCDGTATCGGDPPRWLPCECDEPEAPLPSRVGAVCIRDTDCEADETCLDGDGASFLGGVPAVSFCTLRCDGDPDVCEQREPAAVCVVTDDRGNDDPLDDRAHCLEVCTIGAPSADKCQGSERLACATLDSIQQRETTRSMAAGTGDEGACRPLCTKDSDCSPNTCNRRTGACERATPGDGFGAECDPLASDPSCEGICVEVEGVAFCSQRCWFGSAENCGDEGAEQSEGLCRFPEESAGLIGDAGFCAVLCDTDDDCVHPGLGCVAFTDDATEAIVGRAGVCAP